MYQLQNEIKLWMDDIDSKNIIPIWIKNNIKFLYLLTILTGSSHSAVGICNSNLFSLNIFDMGLNKRQLAIFNNKRYLFLCTSMT